MIIFQRVLGGFDVSFGKVPSECGDFVVAFRCDIEFGCRVSASPPLPLVAPPSPLRSRERGETGEGREKIFQKNFRVFQNLLGPRTSRCVDFLTQTTRTPEGKFRPFLSMIFWQSLRSPMPLSNFRNGRRRPGRCCGVTVRGLCWNHRFRPFCA